MIEIGPFCNNTAYIHSIRTTAVNMCSKVIAAVRFLGALCNKSLCYTYFCLCMEWGIDFVKINIVS